jgi:Aminotransferase class I and II
LDKFRPVLIYKKNEDCPVFFHEFYEKDVFLNMFSVIIGSSFRFKDLQNKYRGTMQRDIKHLLNPALQNIATYKVEGGQQAEIKLNQNESPFDLPMWLKEEIISEFIKESWNRYPDILPYRGMKSYADFLGISPDSVMMSNGSNEMLYTIFLACLGPGRKVLIPDPSLISIRMQFFVQRVMRKWILLYFQHPTTLPVNPSLLMKFV